MRAIRFAAIIFAGLFTALSLVGIWGVWVVDRRATEAVATAFSLIDVGVETVNAGVGRVEDLIATSRVEVRQASETITAVGAEAKANSPVLSALHERLETRLVPRIGQMDHVMRPVRDAAATVVSAVSFLNSMSILSERAPRLAKLDESFTRLEELVADGAQLRSTLRTLVVEKSDATPETLDALNGLTERIDRRLGQVQANVQEVQADIAALRVRLDNRKAAVLSAIHLAALLSTLTLVWIIYTQVVVIRHHRDRIVTNSHRAEVG